MAKLASSKTKKKSFNYVPRDPKAAKERAERTGARFDSPFKQGFDTWRPKAGSNKIRILPATWDEPSHYGFEIEVHKYVGSTNSTYLCRAKNGMNKPCAICKAAKEAKAAGEEDEAKQLQTSTQTVCWILDRAEDEQIPLLYPLSFTMDREITSLGIDEDSGKVLPIDHPDEGFDIRIKRAGAGLKTKYFGIAIDREPSPITDDTKEWNKIMDFIEGNPIPEVLHFFENDYLSRIINEEVEEKDEDADEDEDDRPRGKKKKRPADDEDDDEDTGDGDEDDEDEKPKKGRKAAAKDDEDDEDPADEDEDEDPKPKKGRRAAAEDGEDEDDEDVKPKKGRRAAAEDDDDEDEDDEDTKPKRRGKAAAKDDDEDDDDGEEEETTTRRGKKSSKDEDDEDDGEEEDDDPKPKKGSRRNKDEDEDADDEDDEDDEDEPKKKTTTRVKLKNKKR